MLRGPLFQYQGHAEPVITQAGQAPTIDMWGGELPDAPQRRSVLPIAFLASLILATPLFTSVPIPHASSSLPVRSLTRPLLSDLAFVLPLSNPQPEASIFQPSRQPARVLPGQSVFVLPQSNPQPDAGAFQPSRTLRLSAPDGTSFVSLVSVTPPLTPLPHASSALPVRLPRAALLLDPAFVSLVTAAPALTPLPATFAYTPSRVLRSSPTEAFTFLLPLPNPQPDTSVYQPSRSAPRFILTDPAYQSVLPAPLPLVSVEQPFRTHRRREAGIQTFVPVWTPPVVAPVPLMPQVSVYEPPRLGYGRTPQESAFLFVPPPPIIGAPSIVLPTRVLLTPSVTHIELLADETTSVVLTSGTTKVGFTS